MEHMLSRPPQATRFPEGAYAQVITHEDLRGMAFTCGQKTGKLSFSTVDLVDSLGVHLPSSTSAVVVIHHLSYLVG